MRGGLKIHSLKEAWGFESLPLRHGTSCASLPLHLHQVVKRTFTSKLSNMLGTPIKTPPKRGIGTCTVYKRHA